MAITAALVKELRERTGAGMMECKKALVEMNGDIDAAIEHMRKTGMAKADKKAGRAAAEGLVAIKTTADAKTAAIVEVNCETDFVAKDDNFQKFVEAIVDCALTNKPADLDALLALSIPGAASIEEARKTLIAKIGENMNVRRFQIISAKGALATYMHGTRIGVVVDLEGGTEDLGKDIAMHIAASRPICVDETGVSKETIEKEKEIYTAQAQESGKPAEIIEKMVEGRVRKYYEEVTLLAQTFVIDGESKVEEVVRRTEKEAGAPIRVTGFVRYALGEGVAKEETDFAAEVAATAGA